MALIAWLFAPSAFNSSLHRTSSDAGQKPLSWTSQALADLDRDFKADRAILRSNGFQKTIDIRFANLRTRAFSFVTPSQDQGKLVTEDIEHDGDVDLIWIGAQKGAVVLINDGKGDFTEAKDNAPYAAELNALLRSGDSSDPASLQAADDSHPLVSSPFSDIAAAAAGRFICPTIRSASFAGVDPCNHQSPFLGDPHKRGPPLILS